MSSHELPDASIIPVRQIHRFDEAALAEWMQTHIADYDGPLTVKQLKGGQSNPTYMLSTPKNLLRRHMFYDGNRLGSC
jgi:aminoglycoside phosphotransferase (APT) family kinase protein